MAISIETINRIGFLLLGLTNNFAYVVMLSAAVDLLNISSVPVEPSLLLLGGATSNQSVNSSTQIVEPEKYCNEHSTGSILLADSMPSLIIKSCYGFLLVGIRPAFKAPAVAFFSATAFVLTGLSTCRPVIVVGVVCASLASGLGEAVYLSFTPDYGDVSLIGWSMGTGAAGLVGSMLYAVLKSFLSIRTIMLMMLVMPFTMMVAYFFVIKPLDTEPIDSDNQDLVPDLGGKVKINGRLDQVSTYGTVPKLNISSNFRDDDSEPESWAPFDLYAKLKHLPSLAKYFLPLTLVYFAEYFINQGLFELIYFPEITYLDHAAQYRWFQVSYQIGVVISRWSLDFFIIRNIWAMSILQVFNAILFLAHAAKWIYIPNFYLVVALIVYEGLLGGFTYVNTFYRIKQEVSQDKQAFSMSTTAIGDSIGIVTAGFVSIPVHDALCKLYP